MRRSFELFFTQGALTLRQAYIEWQRGLSGTVLEMSSFSGMVAIAHLVPKLPFIAVLTLQYCNSRFERSAARNPSK